MKLQDYYKRKVAEYGYELKVRGKADSISEFEKELSDDIYFNDEMDYYICADYYGCYVGDKEAWTEEEKQFLSALGFEPSDFIENEMIEALDRERRKEK